VAPLLETSVAARRRGEDVLELGRQAVVGQADLAAELGQHGAGGVGHFGAGVDAPRNLRRQGREVGQTLGQGGEQGQRLGAQALDGVAQRYGQAKGGLDVEQLAGL